MKHLDWWNSLKHYEKQGYCNMVFPLTIGTNYHDLTEDLIKDIYKQVQIYQKVIVFRIEA